MEVMVRHLLPRDTAVIHHKEDITLLNKDTIHLNRVITPNRATHSNLLRNQEEV
jgi:hypothetical protein